MHAPCVGPARRHSALLAGMKAAVARSAIVGTPRPVGFSNSGPNAGKGGGCQREESEGDAGHGEFPLARLLQMIQLLGGLFPAH